MDQDSVNHEKRQNYSKPGSMVDLNDLYKIVGDFIIVEDAFGTKLNLATKMAKGDHKDSPNLKMNEDYDADSQPIKKSRFRKADRSEKYLIYENKKPDSGDNNSNNRSTPRKESIDKEKKVLKYVTPESISLHFEDEKEIQIIEKPSRSFEAESKMDASIMQEIEKQYPRPKFDQTIDFRANMINESIHN